MENTKEARYAEIARRVREMPLEKPGSNHKWEELVNKMCASDNDELYVIGTKEREAMKHTQPQTKKN